MRILIMLEPNETILITPEPNETILIMLEPNETLLRQSSKMLGQQLAP